MITGEPMYQVERIRDAFRSGGISVGIVLLSLCGSVACVGHSEKVGNSLAVPGSLAYSVNPAVYAVGVAIPANTPHSSGGAVTSYSVSPSLPAGLGLDTTTGVIAGTPTTVSATATYTVTATNSAGSATVGLVITVNAVVTPPAGLSYSVNPAVYAVGVAIPANTPHSSGGAVTSYSVSPSLPAGLGFDTTTGVISGTPTAVTATATYTVTAANSAGSTTVGLVITVNAAVTPPAGLAYSVNPAVYTVGVAIPANTPSSSGGAVTAYSVAPPLPAGLGLDTTTGVISGTPTAVTATATYTVTAANSAGSTTVGLVITVNTAPPAGLSYSANPAVYTVGFAIPANTPSSSGGAVTSYSVAPPLPAGLGLDTTTGVIAGTPTAVTATATYTVTAANSAGSTTVALVITVNAAGSGSTPVMRLAASTWENYATANSMTTPTFSTQGAVRTLVAVVSWYPPHTDPWPTTMAWAGGTPAGASGWQMVIRSYETTIHWCTEIWVATTSSQLFNVAAIATRTDNDPANPNDPSTGIFAIYEVAGARPELGGAWEHHATATEVSNNVYVTAVNVTVTPTATDSLILGISQYGDFYSASAANALTTIDYQQNDGHGDGGAAAWHKTTATVAGTPYTLGVTLPGGNTRSFSACAVELLAP